MRQAGKLPTEEQARRFVDYLLTKKVPAKADAENGEFGIWIHEEDQFQEARRELEAFRDEPNHERYRTVAKQAESIRSEQVKRVEEARKRVTTMQGKWNRQGTQSKPLTMALIVISVLVFLLSSNQGNASYVARTLAFADPIHFVNPALGLDPTDAGDKLVDIQSGQIWRTITPIFLHGDIMHIAFNMLLMYQLGSLIEPRIGTPRYGLLVLLTALASVTLTSLMPFRLILPIEMGNNTFVIGMSGVVFGLIGYLWGRTVTEPFFGLMIKPTIFFIAVAWIVVGVLGVLKMLGLGDVSNWGHLLGLLAGLAIAYAEHAWRRK
jgi:GlpG protein